MNRIITMRLMTRVSTVNNQQIHSGIKLLNKDESSSSDSSDSDNEKPRTKRVKQIVTERNEESKKQTVDLLNSLLMEMSAEKPKAATTDRAIPRRKPLPTPVPKPTLEEKLIGAAKEVSASLGGDVKQNEVDLLNKVFSVDTSTLKSTPPTESTTSKPTNASKSSLSDLLAGMNIDRAPSTKSSSAETLSRSQSSRIRNMARRFGNHQIVHNELHSPSMSVPANLYGGTRLNIFDPVTETSDDTPKLKTWDILEREELKSMMLHPPENIFEEMIQWTEKGMLWKFPIDNEIGMEEEQNVHFSEHVFMERHLQGWCPSKGPIRHFMELVCVGLSKNPYMTVKEKKDHIMWYQDFFSSKQELLTEVGAVDRDIPPSDSTKQIKS